MPKRMIPVHEPRKTDYRIVQAEAPEDGRIAQQILSELLRYNASRAGPADEARIVLSARGRDEALVGGLVGWRYWNGLFVELLWVHEAHRGRGIGTGLMQRAEDSLRSRGGEIVFLSTWSFQAPRFYEKLGYRAFGTLQGVPPGGSRIWYCKQLVD